MNITKLAVVAGTILGFTGVIAGAMGTHALEQTLTLDQIQSFETAVRYQMYHALLLLLLAVFVKERRHKLLNTSIFCSIVGVLLFSGSIYLLVLSEVSAGIITPIGGVLLIVAWLSLFIWGLSSKFRF